MAFQSPYPSHTHRNPHGNPHTHGSPGKNSLLRTAVTRSVCRCVVRCIWAPQMYMFIGLYALYGVIHGLTDSVRLLVGDGDGVPDVLQTTLSVLAWSPLISVVIAPIVEAVHMPYVGRRKTWLVGAQYAVGAVMLLMLPIAGSVTDDLPLMGTVSAVLLAISLGVLHLLAAVHEIATDAWGKNYVHHKYIYAINQSLTDCQPKIATYRNDQLMHSTRTV